MVSSVPGYGENTVAEFTFGLILSLARKIYPAIARLIEDKKIDNFVMVAVARKIAVKTYYEMLKCHAV